MKKVSDNGTISSNKESSEVIGRGDMKEIQIKALPSAPPINPNATKKTARNSANVMEIPPINSILLSFL